MNLLRRAFSALRTWLGLGNPTDAHLTPSHGWLLPVPAVAPATRPGDPGRPGRSSVR